MSELEATPTTLAFGRAEDVRSLANERGRIFVWRLSRHVYASNVQGHLDRGMAQLIMDLADPMYGDGPISGFHDWFAMTGYDSSSRVDLTDWVLRRRNETRLFIGLRSKIVAMGVSVANLALGSTIATFSTVASLEAELARVMRS